jgi:hypothetical protein
LNDLDRCTRELEAREVLEFRGCTDTITPTPPTPSTPSTPSILSISQVSLICEESAERVRRIMRRSYDA